MSSTPNHTPGPWRWELNLKHRKIELCGGVPRYDITVMDFERWGFQSASPRFLKQTGWGQNNVMTSAWLFAKVVPGREHHASWFQTIDHPDANLIALAPDLLEFVEHFAGNSECSCSDWITTSPDGKCNHCRAVELIAKTLGANHA